MEKYIFSKMTRCNELGEIGNCWERLDQSILFLEKGDELIDEFVLLGVFDQTHSLVAQIPEQLGDVEGLEMNGGNLMKIKREWKII